MKVEDLKIALQYAKDGDDVMIAIKLPYVTAGAIPMRPVKNAMTGFDWESGKFIIRPTEALTPADNDFAEQMKKMQSDLGWAQYENRNLKDEIKRLQGKINKLTSNM
jgi:hypothetical protein